MLRAVDVGETDRFCILLTREEGRCAARVRGARKLGSRLGGIVLPFRRTHLSLAEHGESHLVTAASELEAFLPASFDAFSRMQEGVELLLALTEDGHPLPEVFEATVRFLRASAANADVVAPYGLTLLTTLGLLPLSDDDPRFAKLSAQGKSFARALRAEHAGSALPQDLQRELQVFLKTVLAEQLSAPLKSAAVKYG